MVFDFDSYYSRHFPLKSIGYDNQKLLQTKTVLIAGIGGLGTVSSELLASFGVGKLVLVDYDIIEQSNLARQKLYSLMDVGKSKVEVAKKALLKRNPSISIDIYTDTINELSVEKLLEGVDLVIDGLDRFQPRKFLHDACYNRKIPYIFAGAVGDTANIMTVTFATEKPCLVCALGYPEDNPAATCANVGVNPALLSITASIQVNEAIKVLLHQQPSLEGTMLYIDTADLTFDKITFTQRPDCPVCGTGKKLKQNVKVYNITHVGKIFVDNLCGKDKYILKPKRNLNFVIADIVEKINDILLIEQVTEYAITFKHFNIAGNLMKSGVMALTNVEDKASAIALYTTIMQRIFT